jgi:phosphoglucomutase
MVVKTIVTTDMIDEIARRSNIHCYNVLTGFKWIAELIKEKEKTENCNWRGRKLWIDDW